MAYPVISIVTVCFNSARTLEETMKSVLGQNYPALDYVVIDGGSTDGTLDIIDRYKDRLGYFKSEPDRGISDAFNKGIMNAKGDIICIINSDDILLPGALRAVAEHYDENVDVFPTEITPSELIEDGDELMSTYVSMKNLTVTDTYTTHNGGDNDGALTLTCTSEDNKTITIRTSVLYHEDKTLVLEDELMGKTIDVVGVVDTYDGETQIHVFLYDDITFVE